MPQPKGQTTKLVASSARATRRIGCHMRSTLLAGLLALARAPDAPDMTITHRVFFDVAIDGKPVGQVEIGACH
tara:strand:+ start:197 stop:415 length:219 start_codon:yes stop_codon:yes gene_type:complete